MRKTYIITTLLTLFLASTLVASPKDDKKKTDETLVTDAPTYVEGVVYALPRAGFVIHVNAQKTTSLPGPYNQYAEKYLGLKDVIANEKTSWKITSIKVDVFSEADPNSIFKAMDTVAAQLSTNSSGVISGVKTKGNCDNLSIIGNDFINNDKSTDNQFTDLSSDDFYELIVDPTTGAESMVLKSTETKAREAADYLIRLRKKRAYHIISASDVVPEDGKGYEAFIEEAKRLEKEYISLFAGKQISSNAEYSFVFVPGETDVKNDVLFRFSEEKGILPKTDISGKPILLSIDKESEAFKAISQLKKSDNPDAGKSGIYYRVPVGASLKITDGINTLYSGTTTIPQFGATIPLPEDLLDGDYKIEFNTQSGTIKSITEE